MTGSSHPDIDAVVTAWNTNNDHAAVIAQLQSDAALVAQMRAEIARLESTSGPRALLNLNRPDYVSEMHHRCLSEMLAAAVGA